MNELLKAIFGPTSVAPKELVVLRLLASGEELFGLEIAERSGGEIGRGTLYVVLGRMLEKGLLQSRQDTPGRDWAGPPRRYYRISASGREALDRYDSVLHAARTRRA